MALEGMSEVLRNLAAYGASVKGAAGQALYEEAAAIIQTSQTRFVPVDQGGLRRDHAFVDTAAKIEGDSVSIEFGYSGPYAAAVHENPRSGRTGGISPKGKPYKHWATVGQWKFLEIPVMEAESGQLGRLANRIRNIVGGRLTVEFYG